MRILQLLLYSLCIGAGSINVINICFLNHEHYDELIPVALSFQHA